jgi:hypothetical protein
MFLMNVQSFLLNFHSLEYEARQSNVSTRASQSYIRNCEKVGPLKIWELLTESGRVDADDKNLFHLVIGLNVKKLTLELFYS